MTHDIDEWCHAADALPGPIIPMLGGIIENGSSFPGYGLCYSMHKFWAENRLKIQQTCSIGVKKASGPWTLTLCLMRAIYKTTETLTSKILQSALNDLN